MHIIILMKQVLDCINVEFKQQKDTGIAILVRNKDDCIMNYDDAHSLEMSLQFKKLHPDTRITVLCMGPKSAEEILRECLALGVDKAVLLTDERLIGSDTVNTSISLASAIKKIGTYDLILAGYHSQDGRTGHVGPMVAEKLGIPQLTYVQSFHKRDNSLVGIRRLGDILEKTSCEKPCLMVFSNREYALRPMTISGIRAALKKEIVYWDLDCICHLGKHKATCFPRSIAVDTKKVDRKRKKKIIGFNNEQDDVDIFVEIAREIAKI